MALTEIDSVPDCGLLAERCDFGGISASGPHRRLKKAGVSPMEFHPTVADKMRWLPQTSRRHFAVIIRTLFSHTTPYLFSTELKASPAGVQCNVPVWRAIAVPGNPWPRLLRA